MSAGPFDLSGKTAVVTGAASGLGRASALALARAGARVIAAGLEPEGLEETAEAARVAGGEAVTVDVDVGSRRDVEALGRAATRLGGADILVNNAAVYPTHHWQDIDEEEWDRVFAVNVKGYFLCARALCPQMIERGGGAVVNISSTTFFSGSPGLLHYVSSKGAVVGFTRSLARELGPQGIRVNTVVPGAFPTRAERLPGRDLTRYNEEMLEAQAIKRRGRPEDVAWVVVFLSSEAGSFVTGQALVVDGGRFMH